GPLGEMEREDLTLWFLYLHGTEHSSRTGIGRVLAALSFMFKMQGYRDVTKSFVVWQVAKGLRRGQQRKDTRRPITLNILEGLFGQLDKVCASDYEVALFQLAFSLAFFGAFRIGELVSTKKSEEGGVQCRHVELCGAELQVRIFESKTDKGGKGLLARLHSVAGCRLCPVQCFTNYLRVRKSSKTSLLVHADESVMSRFQFIAVFRQCLTGLGLVDKEYSSHSFRIGAATEAARCGLDDSTIRRIGRWESNRFQLQCVVWVMGHSYIFWAEQRAGMRESGRRFGLPSEAVEVQWHGVIGLSWLQLRVWIEDKFRQEGPPDVLVLHAGGNDVGKIPMRDLIGRMKQDLVRIRARAPRLMVIWSQIVPRLVWRGARKLKEVHRTREKSMQL
ncbi:hypothetical protein XELAEV_18028985mg, partial [Xenopus laevis]